MKNLLKILALFTGLNANAQGILTIGNGQTHTVNVGDTITYSSVIMNNNSILNVLGLMTILEDLTAFNNTSINVIGRLIILGNVVIKNNGSVVIDGVVDIGGNLDVGNGGEITGDGTINVDGDVNLGTGTIITITINENLPIELIDFTYELSEGIIVFVWQTASEINSSFFIIQYSADAQNFSDVVNIPAAGNSSYLINYSYRYNGADGYYRLKQFDYDGNFTIYPSIYVTNHINDDSAQVVVYDIVGQLVYYGKRNEIKNLRPGIYYVISANKTEKIIIQ